MENSKSPEEIEKLKKLIIESIKVGFENNPKFKKTDILVATCYQILQSIYIDKKRILFLDAPTGTGKSIIGYLIHYCFNYIQKELGQVDSDGVTTYTLTSSKMLQEQIESDIKRFDMDSDFVMLKGQVNYECPPATKFFQQYTPYTNRMCKGMKLEDIEGMECFPSCEYMNRRRDASMSPSAVINYSYFLTVLNSKYNLYFSKRNLTIADEGHLVPQIVTGMFNTEITMYKLNQICKLVNSIGINFESSIKPKIKHIYKSIHNQYSFFQTNTHTLSECIDYIIKQSELMKDVLYLGSNEFKSENLKAKDMVVYEQMFKKQFDNLRDDSETLDNSRLIEYLNDLNDRHQDFYFEAESIGSHTVNIGNVTIPNKEYYKFIVKDLSEAELTKKYFINNTDILIFMSATIGNTQEFGKLLGLKPEEYAGFNIPSTFDFSKSPIILCNSGWLNYNNFQTNIHKVIEDTIDIMESDKHRNHKGIVHTSTFQISGMLKERILRKLGKERAQRYLVYSTPEEKDTYINLMKNSDKPYVIIGPSLYEGIDLKDDLGRFNIIVKAPYAGISNYTRKKMERYPFWYERETLEKLQQAIGRTNRHQTDWSITYMMDSMLEKLCWKLPEYITKRITKKK